MSIPFKKKIDGFFKRIFDLIGSIVGLGVFSPLMVVVAILIKCGSSGPVFYRGIRVGQCEKPFKIIKFRTMVENAEKLGGTTTELNDPRITKIGFFLRKYKLDELPQLLNILCGEMSFVGPRPQIDVYIKNYTDEEKIVFSVKPGITDYASIEFINLARIVGNVNAEDKYLKDVEPQKNKLRIKYVREHSLMVDIKILFQTLIKLTKTRNLWNTKNLA